MSDPKLMALPEVWDERRLALLFDRIKTDEHLVLFYFNEVFGRFIIGEKIKTSNKRLAFLGQQNDFIRALIEREELTGKLGRVQWQQATENKRAEAELKRVGDEDELARIQLDAAKAEARLQLAVAEKKIADLSNPSANAGEASPEQIRAANKAKADKNEERLRAEKRRIESDPTLTEEERIRKLNGVDDKLVAAEEEAAKYI